MYSTDKIKRYLWDISGAFGDIGLMFPLAIALIAINGFNPTALFLMAGIFYIASAYYFKITMPVQPLKAMSAIAIATGLNPEVVNAAGITMGVILIIIAFTGVSYLLGKIFPLSVIRGIQLGLGMILIKTSLSLVNVDIPIAILTGIILLSGIFIYKKMPPLIPILIIGAVIALKNIGSVAIGPAELSFIIPGVDNLWLGFIVLVLPQIALTFGNAVVATESTGKTLYGEKAGRLNLKSISVSMGLANIASGFTGGVPMCHGCGGLTAHCKFGATTNRSGFIIGIAFILLAIVFGNSALSMVSAFPKGILGVMLLYVGVQHSLFVRDIIKERMSIIIALTVALIGFATTNLTLGFLAGIGMHYSFEGFTRISKYLKNSFSGESHV